MAGRHSQGKESKSESSSSEAGGNSRSSRGASVGSSACSRAEEVGRRRVAGGGSAGKKLEKSATRGQLSRWKTAMDLYLRWGTTELSSAVAKQRGR
jgi:hypothetical protein